MQRLIDGADDKNLTDECADADFCRPSDARTRRQASTNRVKAWPQVVSPWPRSLGCAGRGAAIPAQPSTWVISYANYMPISSFFFKTESMFSKAIAVNRWGSSRDASTTPPFRPPRRTMPVTRDLSSPGKPPPRPVQLIP